MKRLLAGLMLVIPVLGWAEALPVVRLVGDGADTTRFVEESLEWNVFSTPDGDLPATALLPASEIGFLTLPAGYRSDWHPAPRKQYIMVLEGAVEVEAGDGETRVFRPGSVLLVTDTEGRGHKTNVVGDADVLLVWVPVP